MNKEFSAVLLVAGLLLVGFGINLACSGIAGRFTPASTVEAIWLLVAGIVVSVWGLGALMRGGSLKKR